MPRPSAIRPAAVENTYLKWLLYGDPGIGKSRLTATAENCLILKSRSDNLESIVMAGSKADVWEMTDWNDMEEAYDYLKHDDHGYEFVSFDTITLFQELGLTHIMEDLVAQKSHRKVYLPDKGEYGQNMNRLSMWVRDMKVLPFHFCVVAHAFVWQEDDQDDERRWPLIQGKGMPAKIAGYMNLVTYMEAKTDDEGNYGRILYTKKQESYFAKDGWDAFPEKIRNPTVPQMLRRIEERRAQVVPKKATGATKKAPATKKAGGLTKKAGATKVAGARKATTGRKAS